jgi:integrase
MISHRLRDTFAVDLLEKGVPLEEVSKLLGHESIKTHREEFREVGKGAAGPARQPCDGDLDSRAKPAA